MDIQNRVAIKWLSLPTNPLALHISYFILHNFLIL